MSYTTEQFERLPKWAREHIKDLDRTAAGYFLQLQQIQGKESTGISWGFGIGDRNHIPKGSWVDFKVPNARVARCGINCNVQEENGITFLNINGDGTMIIKPRASNSVRITLD